MAPEVISLLSSPECSPVRLSPPPATRPVRNASRKNDLSFLSDDLNSSLFEYGAFDTPATKKRRLTLTPEPQKKETSRKGKDTFSLLLSEDSIVSDIRPTNGTRYNPPAQSHLWSEISDPIFCSSSAPEPRHTYENERVASGRKRKAITVEDSVDDPQMNFFRDYVDEPFSPLPSNPLNTNLSSRTAAILASIRSKNSKVPVTKGRTGRGSAGTTFALSDDDDDDVVDLDCLAPAPEKKKRATKSSTVDKTAKALERQAVKAKKDQEKAEEKERKRKEKEEKEKQKRLAADIAEVNKSKVDKKVSTPEMILDVSSMFENTSVGNQVGEFMRHLGVEVKFVSTQQSGIVRWRRKVTARYNEEAGHWEPCPSTIEREEHVLCFLSAQEFVDMAVVSHDDDTQGSITLEGHLLKLKRTFPTCKPIYLIEGLSAWMRKNKNIRNRAYQAAVRRQINEETANPTRRKSKKPDAPPPLDEDTIEDALLQLQLQHSCLIHHAAAPAESAEWIKNFTEHISTIPYRQERMNLQTASFCMDVGQVKCGDDAHDTYVKMMQEVQRVTAPMTYGVANQHKDVRALVNSLKRDGPLMLQDVKKCSNKSGALSESRIGPAVSRRLYKVFTGLDPASTEV